MWQSIPFLLMVSFPLTSLSVPLNDIMLEANKHSLDQKTTITDKGIKISCPLQKLDAFVRPGGILLSSNSETEGRGDFSIIPITMERSHSNFKLNAFGTVSSDDTIITLDRNSLTERFASNSNGICQDFIIPQKQPGTGNLELVLEVSGAQVEQVADGIVITIPAGRRFIYNKISVIDCTGNRISAKMYLDKQHIVIEVNDRMVKYPVVIDPTISDADWNVCNKDGIGGFGGIINTMLCCKDTLYVGGSFGLVGKLFVNNIARWNGIAWEPLGAGVNGTISALTCDSIGNIYAGGDFSEAGGGRMKNIAKWNGAKWDPLGSGLNKNVRALACDGAQVYACGDFDTAGGIVTSQLAKWNGKQWEPVGQGKLPHIHCIACDKSANLYVGGSFDSIGGIFARCIAKWSQNTWQPLGLGMDYQYAGMPVVLTLFWHNGRLYAGGDFTYAGNQVFVNKTAYWDGKNWNPGYDYPQHSVSQIVISNNVKVMMESQGNMSYNGDPWIYWSNQVDPTCLAADNLGNAYIALSGSINDRRGNYVLRYNGIRFDTLGVKIETDFIISAINMDKNGNLYVAKNAITNAAKYQICKWDGVQWTTINSDFNSKVSGVAINALAFDTNGNLFVGGRFEKAGTEVCNGIAKWDGIKWSPLGSGVGESYYRYWINDLVFDSIGNLYAGGDFIVPGANIAKWDGKSWSKLGSGLSSVCNSMVFNKDGDLCVAGFFNGIVTDVYVSVEGIAKWNGTRWSRLGTGIPGIGDKFYKPAKAITTDKQGNVYVCGNFDTTSSNFHIVRWDGFKWASLLTDFRATANSFINDIKCDKGGNLYVAGKFDSIGGVKANSIARWDGAKWTALGSGTNNSISKIVLSDSILYAVGTFFNAGHKLSPYIASVNIHNDIVGVTSNTISMKLPSIRYFLSDRKLSVSGINPTDCVSICSLSGRIIKRYIGSSVIILNKISPQPLLIRTIRNSVVISNGMVLLQ
jgi:hypothetical protein